jgi:hypothetical protein
MGREAHRGLRATQQSTVFLLAPIAIIVGVGISRPNAGSRPPLTLITSFDASDLFNGIDESIAAGPGGIVLTNNASVQIRQKYGNLIAIKSLSGFFVPVEQLNFQWGNSADIPMLKRP